MSEAVRWIWPLHGLGGLIALGLLAAELRRPSARVRRAALALLTAVFVVGCLTYPTFRGTVRAELLARRDPWMPWFEAKEHIAAMALALSWGGAMARARGGALPELRATADVLLWAGALCTALTLALGAAFAAHAHGWV